MRFRSLLASDYALTMIGSPAGRQTIRCKNLIKRMGCNPRA